MGRGNGEQRSQPVSGHARPDDICARCWFESRPSYRISYYTYTATYCRTACPPRRRFWAKSRAKGGHVADGFAIL